MLFGSRKRETITGTLGHRRLMIWKQCNENENTFGEWKNLHPDEREGGGEECRRHENCLHHAPSMCVSWNMRVPPRTYFSMIKTRIACMWYLAVVFPFNHRTNTKCKSHSYHLPSPNHTIVCHFKVNLSLQPDQFHAIHSHPLLLVLQCRFSIRWYWHEMTIEKVSWLDLLYWLLSTRVCACTW